VTKVTQFEVRGGGVCCGPVERLRAHPELVAGRRVLEVGAGCGQGLTLAHFSAQLEHFLWDRGCA